MPSLLFESVPFPASEASLTTLATLGRQTFAETFEGVYSDLDLEDYLQNSFNPAQLASEIQDPTVHYYLVLWDNTPVGYFKWQAGGTRYLPQPERYRKPVYLERLYFIQSAQGWGLGAAALHFIAGQAKYAHQGDLLYLTVWENNMRAQRFYQKHGFEMLGQCQYPVGQQLDNEHVYGLKLSRPTPKL